MLVADDGDDDQAEVACKAWTDHPNFTYLKSPAKKLWHNWRWVAQQAVERGAEYFLWLQDDDIIRQHLVRRVLRSFDRNPGCVVYCSNLRMGYDNLLGQLWRGNWGPKLPVDICYDQPDSFSGKLLVPVGYFDSWAMSPAKAFRVMPAFVSMLDALPDDCDMFTERLDIAHMGLTGDAICDPCPAGSWIIHGRNESQLTTATCDAQVRSAFGYLDTLMDRLPTWRNELGEWIGSLGTPHLIRDLWAGLIDHRAKSTYAAQILDLFEDVMNGSGINVEKERAKIEAEKALAEAERRAA